MSDRVPSYRLHKPTGQAVVTLDGRDFYLGNHGTDASRAEYDRLIAEWLAGGRRLARAAGESGPPSDLSVSEVVVSYLRHADSYYVKNGRPTSEPANIRPLRRLYGPTPARDFGPLALKVVRQAMIDAGLCRNEVNKRVGRIVRLFKWAVENEMVPASVHHGLKAVAGLRKGRSGVRESAPVKPVPDAFVDAVRPLVCRQVWAMIELARLTGMRPGEVCSMRTCDLDTSGAIWSYTPESHKTEHHGRDRAILIGPRAQEVLRPWLRTDLSAYLFSPKEAMAERLAAMRQARKTPVQPSQRSRKKARPERSPRERWDAHSFYYAIRRACQKAGVPAWHPGQLRHNAATRIRKEFGLDAARAILGHSSPTTIEIYAELDFETARRIMAAIG